ncbi:hypothetical protein JZ751_002308 [Albula glossodonta]|uniref:Reverse transcriptase n=1 Tax=Albula glossodonta TaxID=121402 RepID=A0A8T2PG04_9TELE|nr:hypothetical protein JZ751_002308 [Albula glossodonta]
MFQLHRFPAFKLLGPNDEGLGLTNAKIRPGKEVIIPGWVRGGPGEGGVLGGAPAASVYLINLRGWYHSSRPVRLLIDSNTDPRDPYRHRSPSVAASSSDTSNERVEAVAQWLHPEMVRELRAFLGLTGYYRCFKDFAKIAMPLNGEMAEQQASKRLGA